MMRIMFRSFYLVVVVVVTALAAVSVTANNSGIVDNVVDNVVDITVDIVDTIIPIIDHVSDDEYPMIKRPIQTGTIKLTDSTHTSSSSSSSSRLSKIKYTINSKQKIGSDENISNDNDNDNDNDNENENENKNRKLQAPGSPGTNLWSMDDPTVDYSENEFDGTNRLRLGYTTSNIIEEAMFTSTWWTTDCKAGGNAIETEGAGYRFIYTSANITNTNNTDGSSSSSSTGTKKWYVAFEAAPTLLAQGADQEASNAIYKEYFIDGTKYGMAEVCVRVSLQTPSGIEVNYIENILTIHYYFSDGFYTLDEFNVQKQDAEVTGIDMGSIIRAYDCSLQTTSGIKSQGMVLRVCIEPMPAAILDGFRMKAIEEFYYEKFSKENPDDPPFQQDAVINSQEVQNQLTLFTCVRGQEQCVVETMLMAVFYQTQGSVEGRGVATMQLGNFDGDPIRQRSLLRSTLPTPPIRRRSLGGWKSPLTKRHRNLQEQEQETEQEQDPLARQEFNINFEVEENVDQKEPSKTNSFFKNAFGGIGNGNGSSLSLSQTTYHSIGATIGIICLLLLNIFAVTMLVMQFPYFRGKRLYLS